MAKKKEEPASGDSAAKGKASTASASRPSDAIPSAVPGVAKARNESLWYGGSWRGKAAATAEVARENAAIAANAISERVASMRVDEAEGSQQPAQRTFLSPSKSTPSAASMTKLNITSKGEDVVQDDGKDVEVAEDKTRVAEASQVSADGLTNARPLPAPGWRGWWSKGVESEKVVDGESPDMAKTDAKPSHDIEPNVTISTTEPVSNSQVNDDTAPAQEQRSWFGLWNTAQVYTEGAAVSPSQSTKSQPSQPSVATEAAAGKGVLEPPAKESLAMEAALSGPNSTVRSSTGSWAFWSRDRGDTSTIAQSKETSGELAVANTSSQSNPKPVDVKDVAKAQEVITSTSKRKDRPQSLNLADQISAKKVATEKASASVTKSKPDTTTPQDSPARPSTPQTGKEVQDKNRPASIKSARPNLVLPSLRSTYKIADSPSYWQQLSKVLGRYSSSAKCVAIDPHPQKITKAIAIGVHGYFPAQLIQKVLGPPTGTSIRFANEAAAALHKWAARHNHSCDVEKISLEGEGMIADRVDILWKLLLNWIDQIRKADAIFVGCHSQGVPVAVMLVARLIDFGCVSPQTRIGICAMAGVNLGPFSDYRSRFFGGSAAELFEFARHNSSVSQRYEIALKTVLGFGVRVVYVGSIDDQLVSMESSTFASAVHPYIYRAVFVDGRIHAPDFISNLVGFALKLRNLGISDHGLIRELSLPLAGNLYSGEGHSRIYEDPAVYDLSLEFALETTMVAEESLEIKKQDAPSTATTNPFILPWALRGALEEDRVRSELKEDTELLLKQFEHWKPSTKGLKDVKFRLEAVRSKLA